MVMSTPSDLGGGGLPLSHTQALSDKWTLINPVTSNDMTAGRGA